MQARRANNTEHKFCFECGSVVSLIAEICPRCGVRLLPAPVGKDRAKAVFLALLFGFWGVHRFYLGQAGRGFLCFVFCWTFIPWVISWVDVARYLWMSNEEFSRTYPL